MNGKCRWRWTQSHALSVSIIGISKIFGGYGQQSQAAGTDSNGNLVCVGKWCSKCKGCKKLREIGADAVLIGETLMRAADKRQS